MERQRRKRITVNVSAELIVEDKRYQAVIQNVSECGACVNASLSEYAMIIPGTLVRMQFSSDETQINLLCSVIWVLMNKIPVGFRYKIGMEIVENAPEEYKNFLKTLYI